MRKADPRAEAEDASSTNVGDVICGKYRVERVIGQGGMGVVVAAKHLTLDRSVAIKLLNAQSQHSDEALGRFTREARSAAKIKSEHVGSVLDVDVLPNGAPFIVMELLEGQDLADELLTETKVSSERAVTIVLQACEAVAEAHASGIVHRDLKPANLFLTKAPGNAVMVKVLDFGISKITRREEADSVEKALTNPSTMLGSPLYMSPEQMKGSGDVDSRTDIWSMGVIMYELVSGRSPFDANTIPMICANVLSQQAAPLEPDGVAPELEQVIRRCLERDPDKRYRDIAHLARALEQFAPDQGKITLERINRLRDADGAPAASPASMTPPPMKPKPVAREGAATSTAWEPKPASSPRKKILPVAFGVGLAVVILGFIGIRAVSSRGDAVQPAARPVVAEPAPEQAAATDATGSDAAAPVSSAAMSASATPEPTAEPIATASASTAASAAPSVSAPAVIRHGAPKPGGRTKGFGGRE